MEDFWQQCHSVLWVFPRYIFNYQLPALIGRASSFLKSKTFGYTCLVRRCCQSLKLLNLPKIQHPHFNIAFCLVSQKFLHTRMILFSFVKQENWDYKRVNKENWFWMMPLPQGVCRQINFGKEYMCLGRFGNWFP